MFTEKSFYFRFFCPSKYKIDILKLSVELTSVHVRVWSLFAYRYIKDHFLFYVQWIRVEKKYFFLTLTMICQFTFDLKYKEIMLKLIHSSLLTPSLLELACVAWRFLSSFSALRKRGNRENKPQSFAARLRGSAATRTRSLRLRSSFSTKPKHRTAKLRMLF